LVFGLRELELDAVDAIHAVDEEDEDEYEGNLLEYQSSCGENVDVVVSYL
jgi:hypothetical protein